MISSNTQQNVGVVADVRPVFISGVYRSSTTFLAALVGCHEQYRATSSLVKFMRFCLYRFDPIQEPENHERLVDEAFQRVKKRWDVTFDAAAALAYARKNGVSYASLYDALMRQILIDNGGGDGEWIDKTAVLWSRIPDFLSMFPKGKVIHILRDPRSVCASYKKITNEPGYTYLDAAFNTVHAIQSVRRYVKELGPDRILLLKSEDLLTNPEHHVAEICDFLDVPFSDRMMQPDKFGEILGEDWKSNTSFRGTLSGFHPPSEYWRKNMSAAEIKFVEMITQPYLSEFGYDADGLPPTKEEWSQMYNFLEDPLIRDRFSKLLKTGEGSEGYRTDPYLTEMRIVFPERFEGQQAGQ
ncbi:sulfotransferase family protein [Hwanghaeella sp. LZ110]|uniref:sulfotransferase family protein n=1 Tax=Hwanghaeella sp. LZ110 TaxID=3402810 RepID=UPI003B67CA92